MDEVLSSLFSLLCLLTVAGVPQLWAGAATSTGVFRASGTSVILDINGDGSVNFNNLGLDRVFYYPMAADQTTSGDKPVVGDWNGDGRSKIGVFL